MIHFVCGCGAQLDVLEVYAGGHVVCQSCGASVAVPVDDGFNDEKFRFHCPHCETRVIGRKASAGKKSECPACGKIYIVPDPPLVDTTPEVATPAPGHDDRRIKLETDELLLRFGLPFPVGKLEKPTPPAPQPRFLHQRAEGEVDAPAASSLEPASHNNESTGSDIPTPPRNLATPAVSIDRPELPSPNVAAGLPPQAKPYGDERFAIDSSLFAYGSGLTVTRAAIPQMSSPERPASAGELQVLGGHCSGQRIRMNFRQFLVGTERDCDLRTASALLSRHHCVFKKDEYALRIRDLGSNNGTFVNGRRICGEVVLNPGDDVTIGEMTLHVVLPYSPHVVRSAADSNPSMSDFVIL